MTDHIARTIFVSLLRVNQTTRKGAVYVRLGTDVSILTETVDGVLLSYERDDKSHLFCSFI